MEFPTFTKEINGHQMVIEFTGDEDVEQAALWCATCDPDGEHKLRRDVTPETLSEHSKDLMGKAESHANPPKPGEPPTV